MDQSTLSIICLIVLPLAAHLKFQSPAAAFAAAALVYLIFGTMNFAETQIILSNVRQTEASLHDTYYVVSTSNGFFYFGLLMAFCATLTSVQTRFGAMKYPKMTKALFWPFHLGFIATNSAAVILSLVWPLPRRYVDYPEYYEAVNRFSSLALLVSIGALLFLVLLLVWSLAIKWRAGD